MSRLKIVSLILTAAAWVGISDPHFAFLGAAAADVQEIYGKSETQIDIQSSMTIGQDRPGRLLVVAFKDGVPAANIAIRTPKGVLKTNFAGVMSVILPAGQNHVIEVEETNQQINIQIVADEETQVIVNLLTNKNNSTTEVEAPQAPSANKTSSNAPKKSVQMDVTNKAGDKIPEATVLFSGVDAVYKTDASGKLQAELPEGVYSASVFHPNFQTHTIPEFKVGEGAASEFSISLKPAENQLEDVVVLAPKIKGSLSALVEVRKQSSAVTDVLGAEQMARAGDSDAAASLRRVTGLTLVGGKYVYVRGLGERYSGVQMNSFSLPSPEPARRVVPLDLFPTSVMESIVVQKSYSPDLPGEFGGGIIQLKTRSLPEKFFFRAAISTNYENTGNGVDHTGGGSDWLGMDDGAREMPALIKNAIGQGKALQVNNGPFQKGVSEQELTAMGQSIQNNYDLKNNDIQAMPGMSMSVGNGWNLSGVKVGTSGSFLYGQSAEQLVRMSRNFSVSGTAGKLEQQSVRSTNYTEIETRVAGSLDLGVEIAKVHRINASTFLLRNTTKLSQLNWTIEGQNVGENNPTEGVTMDFTERQLWTRHLKGSHGLQKTVGVPLQLDWRLGWADADRDSPFRREISYDIADVKTLQNDAFRATWSELFDATEEQGIDLTLPINNSTREIMRFKVGALELEKNRDSVMNRISFVNRDPSKQFDSATGAYIPSNMGPNGFMPINISADDNQADNYTGKQNISAQYAIAEVSPFAQLSLQAGLRRETSKQSVRTYNYTSPNEASSLSSIDMNDVLPAYGVVWKPTESLRARVAYSETLARPDFREMSPVGYVDDETGYVVAGNPFLKGTVIRNIDHRWEYYFTSDEYASVGVFHKKFENPIEAVFLAGPNRIQSFRNSKAAENYGIEFEGRVGLRHMARALRRWTFLSNVSFIKSEIEIDPADAGSQTSLSRPLQGQSPYVINVQMQYDRPNWGFSSTLLYNIIGKRITEVGVNDIPDTYEQPYGQLDFTATQLLQKNWTLSFRARNLLNPSIEATQGPEIVREVRRGRSFGVVLGAVF